MDQNGWFRLESSQEGVPKKSGAAYIPQKSLTDYMQEAYRQTQKRIKEEENLPKYVPAAEAPPEPVACKEEKRQSSDSDNACACEKDKKDSLYHSQTIGERGPVVLQDLLLHETLEKFVHTKMIERAVHVKGFGAFGEFCTYQSMKEYTKLCFLQEANQKVPVAARFSLAVSTKGTPDTSRNVRGFSTKFYTDSGNFDLLCNHIPVFLVRDAIRFPDSIQAFLPSPVNNLMDPERFWSFVATAPEAMHFITWLYSDYGTIKSLRNIRASSVNTYLWENYEGKTRYVKYHWLPISGVECITKRESVRLAGEEPDIAGKDLFNSIQAGKYPEYELCVQLMDPSDEEMLSYDPLDDTKIWSEADFPLIRVGKLTLNRNPSDYVSEIEKIAFSPSNLLEGAQLTNDKMLQGRATIYWDAQRRRLGPDFRSIEVNQQKNCMPPKLITSSLGESVCGKLMRCSISKQDDFTQARMRYESLCEEEREHLIENIADELKMVSRKTRESVLSYFREISDTMADEIYCKTENHT